MSECPYWERPVVVPPNPPLKPLKGKRLQYCTAPNCTLLATQNVDVKWGHYRTKTIALCIHHLEVVKGGREIV